MRALPRSASMSTAICRSRIRRCRSTSIAITRPRSASRPIAREGALQRLRLAAGLHHLHAQQPVLGDDGARAAVSDNLDALRLLYVRSASGELVPFSAVAHVSPGPGRDGQSLGAASVGDDVVQPAPGVALGNAVTEVSKLAAQTLPSERSRPRSRAPRRRSRRRSRGCSCCSCSRSWSSTSCSAFCTRASSTRSRSSRGCPSPASARSSRSGSSTWS